MSSCDLCLLDNKVHWFRLPTPHMCPSYWQQVILYVHVLDAVWKTKAVAFRNNIGSEVKCCSIGCCLSLHFLSGCANLLNENQSVKPQLGRFYRSYTRGTVSWPGTWSISWEFLGARLCLFPLLSFFVQQNSPSQGCSFIFCGEFIFYYFLEAKVRSKHLLLRTTVYKTEREVTRLCATFAFNMLIIGKQWILLINQQIVSNIPWVS